MGSRGFNILVVMFWLTTMSWLTVTKILPTLDRGEPPDYRAILEANEDSSASLVGWRIFWNSEPMGWAITKTERNSENISNVSSRLFLGRIQIDELASKWVSSIIQQLLRNFGSIDLDAQSRINIDPLGRPTSFESRVSFGRQSETISIRGTIDGSKLRLKLSSGQLATYDRDFSISSKSLLSDALSPQAKLPGLRIGQQWSMPVFSPFNSLDSPIEWLHASVDRRETIFWHGNEILAIRVEFRSDDDAAFLGGDNSRGTIWVDDEGLVLQQEMMVFNSKVKFVRLSERQSDKLVSLLNHDLSAPLTPDESRHLLERLR